MKKVYVTIECVQGIIADVRVFQTEAAADLMVRSPGPSSNGSTMYVAVTGHSGSSSTRYETVRLSYLAGCQQAVRSGSSSEKLS